MAASEIRARDAVGAFVDALKADATITAQLMTPTGEERVHAHFSPVPPSEDSWARITVRELDTGGIPEHATGAVHLPVQIVVDVAGIPDPVLLLEATHERVRAVLEALTIDTDYGDSYAPVERRKRPTPPRFDGDTRSYYSTALYSVVLV